METYDKIYYDIPPYQEGNLQSFEFDVDASFDMSQVGDITLEVRTTSGRAMIEKSESSGTIVRNGQNVLIPFLPVDTKGRAGSYFYEIDFKNVSGQPFVTMGGKFVINPEINQL